MEDRIDRIDRECCVFERVHEIAQYFSYCVGACCVIASGFKSSK